MLQMQDTPFILKRRMNHSTRIGQGVKGCSTSFLTENLNILWAYLMFNTRSECVALASALCRKFDQEVKLKSKLT